MATFKYTAREPGGKTIKGTIEGRSQEDAVNSLKRRSLMVLKVGATSGKKGAQSGMFAVRPSARKGELELFTRQLSTMISAGIPLLESLEILQEQAESPGFTKTLRG